METSIFLIFTLLLGGGQGNDLLSLIPTDAYWKSKDVEVNVANIMLELNSLKPDDTSKATAVRRLMAIRTLGELKSPDAMSTLKAQLDSKEMFVADYAQRAIDAIEGKAPGPVSAPTSGVPPDQMKTDLYMLPEHCGAVGQVRFFPGKPMQLPKAKEGEENAAGGDARSGAEQIANSLIYVAEMTGNIRVDGVTLGVSDEIGPQSGFIVLYIRGHWDADAVKGAIQPQLSQTRTAGELEFMTPPAQMGGGIAVAMPSNDLFVLTSGPNGNSMPLDDIGAAVKSGKGKFENSTDLIKAIESVDPKQPLWAAMIVSDNYRQAPQLAAFDSMTMVAKPTEDGMKYEARAAGKDADAVKSAVDQFTTLINDARGELTQQATQTPSAQPLADFLNSIELKADGTNATATGVIKRAAP
jgi:hypothetical protein